MTNNYTSIVTGNRKHFRHFTFKYSANIGALLRLNIDACVCGNIPLAVAAVQLPAIEAVPVTGIGRFPRLETRILDKLNLSSASVADSIFGSGCFYCRFGRFYSSFLCSGRGFFFMGFFPGKFFGFLLASASPRALAAVSSTFRSFRLPLPTDGLRLPP